MRLGVLCVGLPCPAWAFGRRRPRRRGAGLIGNYVVARQGVASGGQPSPEGLARLDGLGFRTVVNLRLPTESGYVDEKATVEAQGLRYVHVPLTAASLSDADVAAVAR